MLGKCWTNVERSVQTASTPFIIFGWMDVGMLSENLRRFKFQSTRFLYFRITRELFFSGLCGSLHQLWLQVSNTPICFRILYNSMCILFSVV